MLALRSLFLVALVSFVAACSSSSAPPRIDIVSDPYTLAAGEEKYFCYAVTVDKEHAVDEVVVHTGSMVHHLAVFQVMKGSKEPEGFSECSPQIKQTWLPLYGGGVNTPGMKLPADAAFKFPADTQIFMQLHLVNASPQTKTETTQVELLEVTTDPAARVSAGIFAVGNQTFNIPAGARGHEVKGECDSTRSLDVFALFPHMHQRGQKISLDYGASVASSTTIYSVDPWSFGDQPMQMQSFKVTPGDHLKTTCRFDNNDNHDVAYGESTQDEMCFMILFYTPFERLDGCID